MGDLRRDKGSGGKPLWVASQRRWRAQYVDATGKRHQVSSALPGRKGERQCVKRRDEALVAVHAGLDVGTAAQKVDAYLTSWIRGKAKTLRPRSHQRYEGIVRKHLVPHLGGLSLGRLTTGRIEALYDDLALAGVPAPTVEYAHRVLHSALSDAVRRRAMTHNPADHADVARGGKRPIHPFTPEETTRLLDGVRGHELEVLIILALRTAMRLGELLGLRWSDLNPSTRLISVERTLYRVGPEWRTGPPKSGKARAIAVTDDTLDMLRAYRLERSKALLAIGHRVQHTDSIFLTDAGEPFDGHHLTERRFRPLLRSLDLPARRFHDIRHTAATLMLAAGVHVKVVSEMLGHADIRVTMNTYGHVTPTMQEGAAAALEALTMRAVR
ncbi:MAG: site-specific integrase [Chloroflexi bacterium]|nr:site-specific integrase [Chloroflexota bacterium]